MATTTTATQTAQTVQATQPAKLPVLSIGIAVVLGILVSVGAVGGAGYYLIHSGKLRLQTMPPGEPVKAAPEKTHAVALEPLVVNLADGGYLRASITLSVAESAESKDEKKGEEGKAAKGNDAAVRDTALTVLGRQSSDGLLAVDGKERVKRELKAAFAERTPDVKVADLFFTEFLVQR
jgi:flagellar FliL protein